MLCDSVQFHLGHPLHTVKVFFLNLTRNQKYATRIRLNHCYSSHSTHVFAAIYLSATFSPPIIFTIGEKPDIL